jgi:fluoride exporter
MTGFLLVFVGAGLGGVCRHAVTLAAARFGAVFPWHTMIVNSLGGLAMGLLVGYLATQASVGQSSALQSSALQSSSLQFWRLFAATGVLGGFTTFSAFSLDALELWERGAISHAVAYVVASVAVSIAAVAVGLWLTRSG